MILISLSVGLPRDIEVDGDIVRTGIFKTPVAGRVRVRTTNLDGDRQADLNAHGGPDKAVYAYPSEHYAVWRRELPGAQLDWAAFGENFTTEGLLETDVLIGDRFRIGTAEFVVRQPRMPCYKLGIRFGRPDMVARFSAVDRSGFYLAVEQEGEVGAGNPIERLSRDARALTVSAAYRLMLGDASRPLIELAASHPELSSGWRERFLKRLQQL